MADDLKDIVLQKEQEWRELYQLRLKSLEESLEVCRKELSEEKVKFQQLKEDFKFNLRLLQERDSELEKYEKLFKDLETIARTREEQVSDLKISLAKAQEEINLLADSREQIQKEAKCKSKEQQTENEKLKNELGTELKNVKHKLEKENQILQATFEDQKNHLARDYDEACRKQEREFATRLDELQAENLSLELKVKMINRELDLERAQKESAFQTTADGEEEKKRLIKDLKHKEWELEDATKIAAARQKEMQLKISKLENNLSISKEEASQQNLESSRDKQQMTAKLNAAREKINELEKKLQQEQFMRHDLEQLKNTNEEKLKGEISILQAELKDTSVKSKNEIRRLRSEVHSLKESLSKYQTELLECNNRETGLEQTKAQLELDYSRKAAQVERDQEEKMEKLVTELSEKRKKAESLAAERQRVIEKLQGELEDHKKNLSNEALTQENTRLRDVIRQMREACDDPAPSVAQDYVKGLEKDLNETRTKLRQVEYDLQVARGKSFSQPDVTNASPSVQAYIEQMNKESLAMKQDKLKLMTHNRQLQLRVEEKDVELQEKKDAMQKLNVQLEQSQYELSSQQRAHSAEETALRARTRELESQLRQTRLECDELNKSNIELTAQCQRLTQETAMLQLKDASPALNFGAQELVIQQLQERVLQQKPEASSSQCPENCPFKEKLAQALRQLAAANKDRQHLIQVVNRLRHTSSAPATTGGVRADVIEQQRKQLEQLQRAIIAQELSNRTALDKTSRTPDKDVPKSVREEPTRDTDFLENVRLSKDSDLDRLNQHIFSVLNETLESTRDDLKIEGKKEMIRPKPSAEPQKPQPRIIKKPQKQARNWNVRDK